MDLNMVILGEVVGAEVAGAEVSKIPRTALNLILYAKNTLLPSTSTPSPFIYRYLHPAARFVVLLDHSNSTLNRDRAMTECASDSGHLVKVESLRKTTNNCLSLILHYI